MQGVKVCKPLHLVAGRPSFGSSNLNQMFPVAADQTCTPVGRNFGTHLCRILFNFCYILGMSSVNGSLEVTKQHLGRVEGVFSSVEAILLLIYVCALGRCPVASPVPAFELQFAD